ncbi:hypothetical protein [Actinoplanes derwentensis]|uniref:Uncharacterized protein n=1 Tax=Actinoplanes derwentensis TaxID=113562 RepID=A0A1H2CUT6_9ACTN|nr:hypothetical protein [Actinoplanes derwentensis]GID81964.1 hypothetical protein Ade03nite_08880 [Actinoplanes derwentensis]SDT74221.1 hypothetical protein SAMN04489716_6913 [Actinoplanes derwentensis]
MQDTHPVPTLTPDRILITTKADGREVVIVPDEIARRMEHERKDAWREFPGRAGGESRPFPTGTWMYDTFSTLITAYGDSPIPEGLNLRNWSWAMADRWWAVAHYPELRVPVVGEGDWNPDTRTWRDFNANVDLHPIGTVHMIPGKDAYLITG